MSFRTRVAAQNLARVGLGSLNRLTYSLTTNLGVGSIGNPFSKSRSFWFSLEHKILKRIYLRILLINCTHSRDFNSKPFLDFVFNCNAERSES